MEPDFDSQFESIIKDNGMDELAKFSLGELTALMTSLAECSLWVSSLVASEIEEETCEDDFIDIDEDVIITMRNLLDSSELLSEMLRVREMENDEEFDDDGDDDS